MNLEDLTLEKLLKFKLTELKTVAMALEIDKVASFKKGELLMEIIAEKSRREGILVGYGVLDVLADGYGFLRNSNVEYDIYVSASQIRKFALRTGDAVIGEIREPVGTEKNYAILKIILVNGDTLEKSLERPKFDELIPSYPDEILRMETDEKDNISGRIIDIIAPIGKGQRGLIVAPPKAGKTVLISKIANSIIKNNPKMKVWILLVDERPEEVTDIKETVDGAEVFSSTFDEDPHNHVKVTETVLEKAKRHIEDGEDIFILMDSLTRLARSYNIVVPSSGKLISGGIDPMALYYPKKFFGSARNIKNGGSLTIIATALIDTGSKMDDVIYEEFKGTGNMEIHLDRALAQLRIYPAIDIQRSGTRKEELLIDKDKLEIIWKIRRHLFDLNMADASKNLIDTIAKTKNNDELFQFFLRRSDFND